MAGHSKWHQIKHKKGVADQKRGRLFSELLSAVRAAAQENPNLDINPRLRAAAQRAKEMNVPQENILKAIKKASSKPTEKLIVEAYGPEGVALIIESLTDNKNRTMADIRKTLSDFEAKTTDPGAALWMFEATPEMTFQAKFKQPISDENKQKTQNLLKALKKIGEVAEVYTNAEI